ncbi:hypothetical protein ANN_02417 [Periplaneta americana]|uniref:Uncharacterized protein n=1 Tax=Periplaneta americana TaxID=6978 RepID=A0ABQ8TXZ8_PERAM|nr:hypothetical protein ANN_02417 [Periplaneta americana]
MDLREVGYDGRDWINLAQVKDRWQAFVRAVMNLWVLYKSFPGEYCRRNGRTYYEHEAEDSPYITRNLPYRWGKPLKNPNQPKRESNSRPSTTPDQKAKALSPELSRWLLLLKGFRKLKKLEYTLDKEQDTYEGCLIKLRPILLCSGYQKLGKRIGEVYRILSPPRLRIYTRYKSSSQLFNPTTLQGEDISSHYRHFRRVDNKINNKMALLHFFLVALFCAILGHSRVLAQDQTQNEVEDEGNWKVLYRLITDCAQKSDMSVCLKMKAVTFLDRAITMKNPLLVNDYLSLARDPSYKDETVGPQGRSLKPLSEALLEQSLPQSLEERSERLDDMLQDKVDKFLQSRTVQLNFPADVFEDTDRARCLALQQNVSGSWLHAIPSPNIGTLMDPRSFKVSVALRLACKICHIHKCICGNIVDSYGHHAISCVIDFMSKGRLSRHLSLNDIIKRALTSSGVPSILEPSGISRSEGKRPDGLTLVPWRVGKSLIWDSTCVDTLAPSHLSSTSKTPGSAAESATVSKHHKYKHLADNYIFVPFAVETFGTWSSEAKALISTIGRSLVQLSGDPRSSQYLRQRIGIAIQRGTATSILASFPESSYLDEIFFL